METFTELKNFVINPLYPQQRLATLSALDISTIDAPIAGTIMDLQEVPHCFTLQSCYGHFVHPGQQDRYNLERLSDLNSLDSVTYRIGYLALCIDNNPDGKKLLEDLKGLEAIAPDYIQFGCAEWFWDMQVNSYVLQVEPVRFRGKDEVAIDYQEALHIQEIRGGFFSGLSSLLRKHLYRGHAAH